MILKQRTQLFELCLCWHARLTLARLRFKVALPGLNLGDATLIVKDNHLLSALNTSPVDAASRDALPQAPWRDVDDLTHTIGLDRQADSGDQSSAVGDVLDRLTFAVAEDAKEQGQDQPCQDKTGDRCEEKGEQNIKACSIMKDVPKETKAEQEKDKHSKRGEKMGKQTGDTWLKRLVLGMHSVTRSRLRGRCCCAMMDSNRATMSLARTVQMRHMAANVKVRSTARMVDSSMSPGSEQGRHEQEEGPEQEAPYKHK